MSTWFDRWWQEIGGKEEAIFFFWNFILWFGIVGSSVGKWKACFQH
jgi:hypothetical protein